MKVKCKKCEYEREHLGDNEDYECPLCNGLLNEIKEEFFNSTKNIILMSLDIDRFGADKTWKVIESVGNPLDRIKYRHTFFQIVGKNYEVK